MKGKKYKLVWTVQKSEQYINPLENRRNIKQNGCSINLSLLSYNACNKLNCCFYLTKRY